MQEQSGYGRIEPKKRPFDWSFLKQDQWLTGTGDRPPLEVADRIAERALQEKAIDEQQHAELIECFSAIPPIEGCGLAAADAERFIRTTLQLIELCLLEPSDERTGFVNPVLDRELDRIRSIEGGKCWSLGKVTEIGRRGSDRRFTFGQVKENPDDPNDPSFFGGVWMADCDGVEKRIVFAITAESIPGSEDWSPVEIRTDEDHNLDTVVRARGEKPWSLQVEADSPLGVWISSLAGTPNIGQHSGHIPLGVLSEAVRRDLEPRGLTHLLLGPSRRDPPTRPWHTGSFLNRVGNGFDFKWSGFAIDQRRDALVEARCTIGVRGKIIRMMDS